MNKIIIDGKEFELPQELINEIKSKLTPQNKEKEMEEFFLSCFNGSEILLKNNRVFYKKDGDVIMEQDLNYDVFLFHYVKIWSVFYDKFGLEYNTTQEFLKTMLVKHLKLGSYTPGYIDSTYIEVLVKHLKLGSYTPSLNL